MEESLQQLIRETARELGIGLDDRQVAQFVLYHEEILRWNRKINLVSRAASLDIPMKHFLDSLTALSFLPDRDGRVLDIGSGGGFPALPLKIAAPGLKLWLVESSRKKASFLKHCVRQLALDAVTVLAARVETLAQSAAYVNGFDAVISRATFKLPVLARIAAPFLRPGGLLIAMKSTRIAGELAETAEGVPALGLQYVACHTIRLPRTGDPRNLVLYMRVA